MNRIFEAGDLSPVPVPEIGRMNGAGVRYDAIRTSPEGRGKSPAIYRPTTYEELLYPAEITSDNSGRRDFSGNHIYILNGYLPDRMGSSTGNLGAVIAWERFFDSPTPNARFRLAGGMHIYRADGFQTFYVRHSPIGFAPATAWAFAQSNAYCTPLYLYVTNDVELRFPDGGLLEHSYCYGVVGDEPNVVTAQTLTFTGSARRVRRFIHIQTEATIIGALQITITSNSQFTSLVEAIINPPPATATDQTIELAMDLVLSNVTVVINGGSAGTLNGRLAIVYEERPV